MNKAKTLLTAMTLILISSAASANCDQRPSVGMFAHTKAPAVTAAKASAPVVKAVAVKGTR